MKCDSLANELDAAQRDGRNLATDVFKLRSQNDELHEQVTAQAQIILQLQTHCTDGRLASREQEHGTRGKGFN